MFNNIIQITSFFITEFTGDNFNQETSTYELQYTGHNEPTCHVKYCNYSGNLSYTCTIDPHLCCLDSGNDTVRLKFTEIREWYNWSITDEEIEVVCSLSTKKECSKAEIKLKYNFRTGEYRVCVCVSVCVRVCMCVCVCVKISFLRVVVISLNKNCVFI